MRLIADVGDISRVRLHISYLKSLLESGVKVQKLFRAVYFKQSAWISHFVLSNTKLRDESRDAFEKSFFKLIINSQVIYFIENEKYLKIRIDEDVASYIHCFIQYGKFIENTKKYEYVSLIRTRDKFRRIIANPCYKSGEILSSNLFLAKRGPARVNLCKPIFVGACVLDIAKTNMHR